MFEHDRSAARGEMASRKLIVFRHASALGNAAAHALFERVTVRRKIARGSLRTRRRTPRQCAARATLRGL